MTPDRRISHFWPLQIGGWLAFGVAMSLSRVGVYPLPFMIVAKGALTALGFLSTLGLRSLYARMLRGSPSLARVLVVSVAASYAASLLWTAVYNVFFAYYLSSYFGRPLDIPTGGRIFGGAIYHAFALLAWSVLYIGIRYYHALQEERERALRAEAQAHQAKLRALRYQLNPHFLFNTLNAVSTLVFEERSREAAGMLARLAEFLRLTTDCEGSPEVTLAEELDFVHRYLEIERLRFGERLQVRYDIDDATLSAAVPTLILQPVVENAIKHAISQREQGGRIEIQARAEGATLRLSVIDNGPGLPPGRSAERGVGLANTSERLRQMYGGPLRLDLGAVEGGGLRVSLLLPLRVLSPPLAPVLA